MGWTCGACDRSSPSSDALRDRDKVQLVNYVLAVIRKLNPIVIGLAPWRRA